jgi:hypothetical protein
LNNNEKLKEEYYIKKKVQENLNVLKSQSNCGFTLNDEEKIKEAAFKKRRNTEKLFQINKNEISINKDQIAKKDRGLSIENVSDNQVYIQKDKKILTRRVSEYLDNVYKKILIKDNMFNGQELKVQKVCSENFIKEDSSNKKNITKNNLKEDHNIDLKLDRARDDYRNLSDISDISDNMEVDSSILDSSIPNRMGDQADEKMIGLKNIRPFVRPSIGDKSKKQRNITFKLRKTDIKIEDEDFLAKNDFSNIFKAAKK